MRLNKYLSRAGVAARRKCDDLIQTGRVEVNGSVVTEPWHDIDPAIDAVRVDRKPIEAPEGRSYLLLNKPPGTITTVEDTHGRKTVLDLLGKAGAGRRLFPVGRLDADTTGALLITDDGELAFRLTHPRYECHKEYVARIDRPMSDGDLRILAGGVELEDGVVVPDEVKRPAPDHVVIILHEGRKRVVRRMLKVMGYTVIQLHRRRFAGLSADEMAGGDWRELTLDETNRLRQDVGLDSVSGKDVSRGH